MQLKWSIDISVAVGEINQTTNRVQVVLRSTIFWSVQRSDQVGVEVAIWDAIAVTILEPVSLVCGIIANIGGVHNLKFD